MNDETTESAGTTTPVNDFGITSNVVTGAILIIIIFLIAVGATIAMFGPASYILIGLIIAALGFTLLITGYTDHPAETQTMGAITVWGKVLRIDGESVAVKGVVFLCNWPLIWISSIKIQGTWYELKFPMTVMSHDKLPMKGSLRVMARAHRHELHHFLNNGIDDSSRWKYIEEEMEGIVENVSKSFIRLWPSDRIMNESKELSELMENELCVNEHDRLMLRGDLFKQRTFGIEVARVQANFSVPDDILKSRIGKVARQIEYDADLEAATKLRAKATRNGETLTLDQALNRVNTLRRIRDGKDSRTDIMTDGKVSTIVMPGMSANSGSGR